MSKNLSCLSFRSNNSPENADKSFFSPSVEEGSKSFYDFTRHENEHKKVHVCSGTACMVAGGQEQVQAKLGEHFTEEEIGHVCCVGRCYENRGFMYNNATYSGNDINTISEIIAGDEGLSQGDCPVTLLARENMLTPRSLDLKEMYLLASTYSEKPQKLIDEIKSAQLRGRGGAGFPIFLKLESFAAAAGTQRYIVCNADEGDPGAYSDRYLLEQHPHLVLFGMLVCALANNATEGIIYIRYEYPEAIAKTGAAIDELKKYSPFPFKICQGKGAYVCGEETSLINSIEGQRPEVRARPPFPTFEGLFGMPTLLCNVETFANFFWILKHGGERFARYGSAESRGNKLVSLDSCFNKPGVYEVELGTSLAEIFDSAGGFSTPLKAVQIGGPLGGIIPVGKAETMNLDFESLQASGFLMGHAGIVGIPENFSMLHYICHLLEFARDESCGKCIPCRIGTQRAYELVHNALENNELINSELLEELLWTMEKGSLCALGGGIPLPVTNALAYFNDELSRHISFSGGRA
jgi:NADH:ubiquinone oxidoreductase subunit F (NADH-binding)